MKAIKNTVILTLMIISISSISLPALAQQAIYWVDYDRQMLNRTDSEGANYEILYMGAQNARQVYIDTTHNRIFWNTSDHIRMASLDGNSNKVIITGTDLLGGLFYDVESDYLWWTEKTQKMISRVKISTGVRTDVLTGSDGLESPTGLLVHNGFLYWGDDVANTISRSTADGENITELVSSAGTVKDIAIDSGNDWLYWTNTENISRSDLTGENSESILSDIPLQLVLDTENQKIYYTDFGGLKVYDLEDQSKQVLSSMWVNYDHPRGLGFSPGDGVYFVNSSDIQKYDFETETPMVAIAPFEPDYIVADFNKELVFWTDRNTRTIYRADAGFSTIEVLFEDTSGEHPSVFGGLAIDTDNEMIFYSVNNVLYGNTYDGESEESLFETSIWIGSLAADPVNQELYFFDTSFYPSSLMKLKYNGTGDQILIDKEIKNPTSLVADIQNEFLYFTTSDVTSSGKIERVKPDGTEREILFDAKNGDPIAGIRALSLDTNNGDLYYGSAGKIYKTATDSSGFSEVYSVNPTQVFGITVNIPLNTGTGIDSDAASLPKFASLYQNYPNPFNPGTVISYQITEAGTVRLEVFDMLGRKVAILVDGEQRSAGNHSTAFDASALSSGLYIYRLQTGNIVLSKQMVLIK